MPIRQSIIDTIGSTPLVALNKLGADLPGKVLVKIEFKNPLGSVKDRPARAMIEAAERDGRLKPQGSIVEPTSGNTGIGLAMVAAVKDYKLTLTMPESMSLERRKLLAHLGATVVLTKASEGMRGAINKAEEIARETGAFFPDQFSNPANPNIHRLTTAEEIWADTNGHVDFFVSAIGTGGTITGVAEGLKPKNSGIKIVAVEPKESAVLSGGQPGPHPIQGIGAGFVPPILNVNLIDEIIAVSGSEAIETAKKLSSVEGILAGISSGAAVFASLQIAARPENAGRIIVTVLPSTGERYLSTALFE